MNNNAVQLNAEYSTAITGKGLWPNMKVLADGLLGVFIYNQPSHGYGCGDVEMHVSDDSGKSWQLRSRVSDHSDEPLKTRMNHAVGINTDGDIVVIVSGWSEGRNAPVLNWQVCISKDNGISWARTIFDFGDERKFIPFGDMTTDKDGNLIVALYARLSHEETPDFYLSRSSDGGCNWQVPEYVASAHGEVTLLRTKNDRWFAAGRDVSRKVKYCNQRAAADPLVLFTSPDGYKWTRPQVLTLPGQIPGHLLELSDGRLLVTYGSRIIGLCGVQAVISDDGGETWSVPAILINYKGPSDCGYPSTVELENGQLLTAFYAGKDPDPEMAGLPLHPEYHMGTLLWSPDIFAK